MSKTAAPAQKPEPAQAAGADKLMEFYLTDFKDLSDKLEKTDTKVQFFVQLYIGIITASIALLAEKLMLAGHYGFGGCFWLALGAMGYFVMEYALAGFRMHHNYVNRLNELRSNMLRHYGKDRKFIEAYGYTGSVPVGKSGMTAWMIHFLQAAAAGFLGASVYCFVSRSGLAAWSIPAALGTVALVLIGLELLIRYRFRKMGAGKKEEKHDAQK